MAQQLEKLKITDSLQEWVDKINKILEVGDMLGIKDDEFTDTTVTITKGLIRAGTRVNTILEQTITLPYSSHVIVGVNVDTSELVYFEASDEVTSSFLPLYEIYTDSDKIITVNDQRTWAVVSY
jgi:hypothetical protein